MTSTARRLRRLRRPTTRCYRRKATIRFIAPSPQSGLVNGAAVYNCQFAERGSTCEQRVQRDMPELRFPANARVRLRFINAGAHPVNWVSVDEHELYIIESDNTPTLPVPVHRIPVNVAQRYSGVLLTSGHRIGDSFYLRAQIHTACFGAAFPDLDPQTRLIICIADEGHRLTRTLPRSRDWDTRRPATAPTSTRHAPPQADQISFFNSSRIGPLTTTDEAGLSDGISFLEWTLCNVTYENFAGLNQALAVTSVFYGSDLASLTTPEIIQALAEDFVGQALENLAIASGLMASKTQARKAIEAGTIQLNGTRIPPKSHQRTISEADLLDGRLVVIKAGKTAHKAVLLA